MALFKCFLPITLQDREQRVLSVVEYDISSGAVIRELIREESIERGWINLAAADCLVPLRDGASLLWASERSGFCHLYCLDDRENPQSLRQITSGDWQVDCTGSSFVDEKRGKVYFLGNMDDPRECHLLEADLNATCGKIRRITMEPGMHTCIINNARTQFVDTLSATDVPYRVTVKDLNDGSTLKVIYDASGPDISKLALKPPEFTTVQSFDGRHVLYMSIYKPPVEKFGPGPYPLLVSTYGHPIPCRYLVSISCVVTIATIAYL